MTRKRHFHTHSLRIKLLRIRNENINIIRAILISIVQQASVMGKYNFNCSLSELKCHFIWYIVINLLIAISI